MFLVFSVMRFIAALLLFSICLPVSVAFAQRYEAPRPNIIVSPNRVDAWVRQLEPQQQRRTETPRRTRTQRAQNRGFLFFRPQVDVTVQTQNTVRARPRSSVTIDGRTVASPSRVQQASVRPDAAVSPKTPPRTIDPKFLPANVSYYGPEAPGTIVINTSERYLYLVGDDGTAKRYGVGVGREGFSWKGTESITRKAEWPTWRPPAEMIARERAKGRELPAVMEGGPDNPLGARALYLGSTLYRIHGSNAPWSIGQAVSSGCIRMRNEDVIDLYGRVGVGTVVKVL